MSEDALPAAGLLSRTWNCVSPFHSDTCWEQLSGDSPAALLVRGLRSTKWRVYGNQADWFSSFPRRLSQALIRGKRDLQGMINAQKQLARVTPMKQCWSITWRTVGEQSAGDWRVVWSRGPNTAPVARRWKQGWICARCRSWKVTGKERSGYTCCLLTVVLQILTTAERWDPEVPLVKSDPAMPMAAWAVASSCFLFAILPEDFTASDEHLDPTMPGMWAAMHACNSQRNFKTLALTLHFPFPYSKLKGEDNLAGKVPKCFRNKWQTSESSHIFLGRIVISVMYF